MTGKKLIIIILGLLVLVGCARFMGEGTAPPTAVPVEAQTPQMVLRARREVLAFLREGANECVPPPGVIWKEQPGTAPGGFEVFRFNSEGCDMTISYPLPESGDTLYHVTLHNSVTGFCWQANVDAGGEIVATGTQAGLLPELSNAAAAFCQEQGGTYSVPEQEDGVPCGVCTLENGQSCNAWAFFQGMCPESP